MKQNRTEWGLHRAVPEGARAVWGARGIFNARGHDYDGTWDLVYQDVWGETPSARDSLIELLGTCRVGEIMERTFQDLANRGLVDRTSDTIHELYDGHGMRAACSTNASYGYIYVSAWLEPLPLPLDKRSGEIGPGELTWSNDELPEVGDHIKVTTNGLGPAKVVGYCSASYPASPNENLPASHYLFTLVRCLNPPTWYLEQSTREFERRERPQGFACAIMGREWRPLEES